MKGELLLSILLIGSASAAIPRLNFGASLQNDARNVCENKIGGIVADPNYCYKFVICVLYMEMSSVSCNAGEIYHGNTCREGNQETCVLGKPAVPETTIMPTLPTTTNEPPPLLSDLKEICMDVFFAARPYLDCGMFAGCIRGSGTVFSCAEDQIFDPNLLVCVEGDRHACTSTPTPTPTPSTRFPTTTATSLETICHGVDDGSLAHPSNCGLWIVCIQENYNIRQCPLGQIWLSSEGECKNGNPQTCELFTELNPSTVTEPTEATTEALTEATTEALTEATTEALTEATTEALTEATTEALTEATTEAPTEATTESSPSSISSTDSTIVTPDSSSVSTEGTTMSNEITSVPTEATTVVINYCEGIDRGNVAHPTAGCAWYYQCAFERGTARRCASNNIFNAEIGSCVPGNQSTCEYA